MNLQKVYRDHLDWLDKSIARARARRDRARVAFREVKAEASDADARLKELVAERRLLLDDMSREFPDDD